MPWIKGHHILYIHVHFTPHPRVEKQLCIQGFSLRDPWGHWLPHFLTLLRSLQSAPSSGPKESEEAEEAGAPWGNGSRSLSPSPWDHQHHGSWTKVVSGTERAWVPGSPGHCSFQNTFPGVSPFPLSTLFLCTHPPRPLRASSSKALIASYCNESASWSWSWTPPEPQTPMWRLPDISPGMSHRPCGPLHHCHLPSALPRCNLTP